jgi:hypothetical protein
MDPIVTPSIQSHLRKVLEQMGREQANVRFADLYRICEVHFGAARQSGSSHAVFKTPWPGDPRVNIQNDRGKAKVYQVRQVLAAIDKLKELAS